MAQREANKDENGKEKIAPVQKCKFTAAAQAATAAAEAATAATAATAAIAEASSSYSSNGVDVSSCRNSSSLSCS